MLIVDDSRLLIPLVLLDLLLQFLACKGRVINLQVDLELFLLGRRLLHVLHIAVRLITSFPASRSYLTHLCRQSFLKSLRVHAQILIMNRLTSICSSHDLLLLVLAEHAGGLRKPILLLVLHVLIILRRRHLDLSLIHI